MPGESSCPDCERSNQVARAQTAKLMAMLDKPGALEHLSDVLTAAHKMSPPVGWMIKRGDVILDMVWNKKLAETIKSHHQNNYIVELHEGKRL
jgi:hypothetical protein